MPTISHLSKQIGQVQPSSSSLSVSWLLAFKRGVSLNLGVPSAVRFRFFAGDGVSSVITPSAVATPAEFCELSAVLTAFSAKLLEELAACPLSAIAGALAFTVSKTKADSLIYSI